MNASIRQLSAAGPETSDPHTLCIHSCPPALARTCDDETHGLPSPARWMTLALRRRRIHRSHAGPPGAPGKRVSTLYVCGSSDQTYRVLHANEYNARQRLAGRIQKQGARERGCIKKHAE